MSDGEEDFFLGPDDAAIVVRAGGECEVYLPSNENDDDVISETSPTAEVAKLAIAHRDEEVRALLARKLRGE